MQRLRNLIAILVLCSAGGLASAQEAPRDSQQTTKDKQIRATKSRTMATVEQVDLATRKLTLRGDQGAQFKLTVPANVPDLEKVKQGDKVEVEYYSTMALALERPGEKGAATPRVPEPLPTGAAAKRISATFEVVKLHKAINAITLRGPDGELDTVQISDPELQATMSRLKPGDKVRAEYTEAVAISIAPKSAK